MMDLEDRAEVRRVAEDLVRGGELDWREYEVAALTGALERAIEDGDLALGQAYLLNKATRQLKQLMAGWRKVAEAVTDARLKGEIDGPKA